MKDTIKITNKGNTKFVAHRGVSKLETENTAAAFIAAGNRTYYGVETDIYRTADHHYICNHDGRSGRICDVDIKMEGSTLAELRSLTLRDIDGTTDRAELKLATPYEYLKICKKYGKVCVPELKSDFTEDEIAEIIKIFEDEDYLDSTCFISFNFSNLEKVKKIRPDQQCQFLKGADWTDDLPNMLASCGMGLDINGGGLTAERVEACHAAGIEVNVWTIDNPDDAEKFISWGVDYITTNILE